MFTARLATAVVLLGACVSALLLLPNAWWTAITLPVLIAASWEWSALTDLRRAARWAFVGLVTVSALSAGLAIAHISGGDHESIAESVLYWSAFLFWLLVVPLWLARGWPARSPLLLCLTGWIVLVPAWLALARMQLEPERLLALLGIVWLSDTAAYVAGRAWGRHKLAPGISPGKTWEGIAGAAAAVAVYYVAVNCAAPAWYGWRGVNGAVLFAGIAAMGVIGDLFESWVKRQAAVKDSGSLLPGHGGVLDRIDSLTAALPAAAVLLPLAA